MTIYDAPQTGPAPIANNLSEHRVTPYAWWTRDRKRSDARIRRLLLLLPLIWLVFAAGASAQQVPGEPEKPAADADATALAKKLQNPVADLISVPFQNNTNFGFGPLNRTQNILNIQPVIPFHLNEEWNLITRTIIPLTWQPPLAPNTGSTFGVGNTNLSLFLSPQKPTDGIIWGVGPAIVLPTATSGKVGSNMWGAGPSAVALRMDGPWVYGVLVSNVWSFGGDSKPGGNAYNSFLLQPFVNYNFGEGWYINSVPIITANWFAKSGQEWIVPVGGGVGRVIKLFDKLPINLYIGGYYNVIHPSETGPKWQLRT